MNTGIVPLYNAFVAAMDGDDSFDGSVYPNSFDKGGKIIRAFANLAEDYRRFRTPEHPNLLRAMVELKYLRVRLGSGSPYFTEFFNAVLDKARNKSAVQESFADRVTALDDPDEPAIDSKTVKFPFLGIQSKFSTPDPITSNQREEELVLNAYIYHQRFPKQMTANVLGE